MLALLLSGDGLACQTLPSLPEGAQKLASEAPHMPPKPGYGFDCWHGLHGILGCDLKPCKLCVEGGQARFALGAHHVTKIGTHTVQPTPLFF